MLEKKGRGVRHKAAAPSGVGSQNPAISAAVGLVLLRRLLRFVLLRLLLLPFLLLFLLQFLLILFMLLLELLQLLLVLLIELLLPLVIGILLRQLLAFLHLLLLDFLALLVLFRAELLDLLLVLLIELRIDGNRLIRIVRPRCWRTIAVSLLVDVARQSIVRFVSLNRLGGIVHRARPIPAVRARLAGIVRNARLVSCIGWHVSRAVGLNIARHPLIGGGSNSHRAGGTLCPLGLKLTCL